jgi:hypothetical protein
MRSMYLSRVGFLRVPLYLGCLPLPLILRTRSLPLAVCVLSSSLRVRAPAASPKAVLRLLAAIDKVKQQLSGYTSSAKLPVNVECLQDDYDFSSSLTTDELKEVPRLFQTSTLTPHTQP